MNGRDRIQAALSVEGTPEIGVVIPYEGIFIRDHWTELSDKPWWIRISPDNTVQFNWRKEIASRIGQDWFDLPQGIPEDVQDNTTIIELDSVAYRINQREGTREALIPPRVSGWSGSGIASVHPLDPPDTQDEIDFWMLDWVVPGQGLSYHHPDLPQRILNDWGRDYFPMGYINGPLWSCYYLWGFEGMMLRIAEKPELVRYAVQRFTEATLAQIQIYANMGALGLWLEDCMTDMVSPNHFDSLNVRYLRIITEEARINNLSTFHYFCGNPTGKWRNLMDTGADALALEESKKGFTIDITDVVAQVKGKMTVLGNLDAVGILERANDAALAAEIQRQLDAGRNNKSRFIMSLGSPVTPDTSIESVRRYIDMSHTLGA